MNEAKKAISFAGCVVLMLAFAFALSACAGPAGSPSGSEGSGAVDGSSSSNTVGVSSGESASAASSADVSNSGPIQDLGPDADNGGPFDPPIQHPETGEMIPADEYRAMLDEIEAEGTAPVTADDLADVDLIVPDGEYEYMQKVAEACKKGEHNGEVIRIEGDILDIPELKSHCIGARGPDGKIGGLVVFAIDGADEDGYPADGAHVVMTGKLLSDKYGLTHVLHTLPEFVKSVDRAPTEKSGTPLSAYMRERHASFDKFDKGIRSGEGIPESLRLFVKGAFDGYIHDKDLIAEYWDALCAIRIDMANPTEKGEADAFVSFSFDSWTEVVPFQFDAAGYAVGTDGKLYPLLNPDELNALIDSLKAQVKEEQAAMGNTVSNENGAYLWDVDGDGNPEHLAAEFNDNGDEAPSGIALSLYGYITDVEAEAYLDGAYEIESVELAEDAKRPYLLVNYLAGDYYAHDHPAKCALRFADGKLEVEELP